jgi:putative salt-induced outer membrane protein
MSRLFTLTSATATALLLTSAAVFAQSEIVGTDTLNDRLDDQSEAVADDIARGDDDSRFGNPEYRPGLSGSASLGYSGKTGNNESQEFSAGARLRFAQGQLIQNIGIALDFADDNGVKTKEDVFAVYDANYYFNDQFYAFVLGRVETDGLANAANENKVDGFIGVGPGYRIINTPDTTWRVQAGIGVSYLKDGVDNSDTETGYIVSSRAYYRFSDSIFGTNDTDILKSDSALRINNDLGVNFQVSDQFSTRISYLTEYNDSRAIRTDNKVGLSLVYGF